MERLKIVHVVGARPNFMKIAPVIRAFAQTGRTDQVLVHTGQHYDPTLSDHLFEDLQLPKPDYNLGVGSGTHAVQTGRVLIALEPVLKRLHPDWVFTVGDVNSTLAAALTAAKLGIQVAHIEAGLRSHDWWMPEEINRLLTDHLSAGLFTTEESANENLRGEGIDPARVHFVGNVMIDTLDQHAAKLRMHEAMGLESGRFILATLHRPRNVDSVERLKGVLRALCQLAAECDQAVVLALHPRTAKNVKEFGLEAELNGLNVVGALRYPEFLGLMDQSSLVVTDSGGVQEESTVLGVPCITLRPTTERPVTVGEGTNRLFDGKLNDLADVACEALAEGRRPHRPALWDGGAAERIAQVTLALPRINGDREWSAEAVTRAREATASLSSA
jgi:UDP-N-acetylglucosamine 2-epimerase (non-hydrolysing)